MTNTDNIRTKTGGTALPSTTHYRLVRKTSMGDVTLGTAGTMKDILALYTELDGLGKLAHDPIKAYRIIESTTQYYEYTITEILEAGP